MYKHIPTYIETIFKDSLSIHIYIYLLLYMYIA